MRHQILAWMLIVGGCEAPEAAAPASLDGAVYQIPLYQPSRVTRREVFVVPESHPSTAHRGTHTYRWHLETQDPPENVEAFYRAALPKVEPEEFLQKVDENDPGGRDVLDFSYTPGDGAEREEVSITVFTKAVKGISSFRISELSAAARKPANCGGLKPASAA